MNHTYQESEMVLNEQISFFALQLQGELRNS